MGQLLSTSTVNRPIPPSSCQRQSGTGGGRPRFDSLTALRFFPLSCVIFHHARDSFAPWRHVGDSFNLSQATAFFFVFSGFVLAHNYMLLEGKKEIWRFYLSRLSRVWPSHVLSLILLIVLVPEVFKVAWSHVPMLVCNLSLLQAWIPSRNLFFSYNAPSWTCSTLLAMYLLFPLLARVVRSCWFLVVVGSFALVVLSVVLCNVLNLPECHCTTWSALGIVYINPISRMLEFVVGMVAARFLERFAAKIKVGIVFGTVIEVSSIVGIIWLSMITPGIRAASIPALTNAGSLWLSNSGVPIIPCVALILIFALQRGLISKLISTRFFIMLGQISFSMFLLHSVFLAYHTVRCPLRDSSQDALLFLVILFVGSYLMTAAFERPVRKLVMKVSDHLMSTEVRQTMVGDSSEARRSFFPLPAS